MEKNANHNESEAMRVHPFALVAVIRRFLKHVGSSSDIDKSIAMVCRNESVKYREWIQNQLCTSASSIVPATQSAAHEAINKIVDTLVTAPLQPIFLLNDAEVMAEAYERKAARPARRVLLNRKRLAVRPSLYAELADLVNEAVLASDDWQSFSNVYQALFRRLLATTAGNVLRQAMAESTKSLIDTLDATVSIRIVDTGMQGTFALALRAFMLDTEKLNDSDISIALIGVYPWLSELYAGRFVTTDASIVLRVEGISKQHPSDTN